MVGFKPEDDKSRSDVFKNKLKLDSFLDKEASVLPEIKRTRGYMWSHRSFPYGCPLDKDTLVIGMANAFSSTGEEKLGFSWSSYWDYGVYPFYVCPYGPYLNIYDLVYDSFDAILEFYHDLYDFLPTRYFVYRDVSQGNVTTTTIEAELASLKDAMLYKRYEWGGGRSKMENIIFRPNAPFNPEPSNFMLGKNYFAVKSEICPFQPCTCIDMRKKFTLGISDYDGTPIVCKMAKNFAARNVYD